MTTNTVSNRKRNWIGSSLLGRFFKKTVAACLMMALALPLIAINLMPAVANAQSPTPVPTPTPTPLPTPLPNPNPIPNGAPLDIDKDQERRILELIARNRVLPIEILEVLTGSIAMLPLIKRKVIVAKVRRTDIDEIIDIAMDFEGQEVDFPALRKAEQQAYDAKYGKLDPYLFDVVQALRGVDKVKVAFWLNLREDLDALDVRTGKEDLTKEEVDRLIATRQAQLRRATAAAVKSLKSYLGKKRFQIDEVSLTTPLVYATVPVKALPTLARHADVQRIYFADTIDGDYMEIAAQAIRANQVWETQGFTGEGVKVAIVEDSRVDFDNTCLDNNLGTRVPDDDNVDQHATATAGMVASTHDTVRGIAFGAGIFSANGTTYSTANMSAALDAGSEKAHILNNSWGPNCGQADGSMNVHSRHADYIVRYGWDTVVAAAGNNGDCEGFEFVGGVAAGFNVIAVGNYDDGGTADHEDDVMNSSSSFKDPMSTHGDREKPEVAAPGTSITSLRLAENGECTTGNVGSGTSYSAPMVAGVAALLMDAKPSLKLFPEAVKALIMSGATDNIEGSARLSDKDGAGGVNALKSVDGAVDGRYEWMVVRPSDFDENGFIEIPIGIVAPGSRIKVALVWNSNPASDFSTDPLEADLDLNVKGPGVSKWSASWDNSYEVVDFTTPVFPLFGSYKIRIKNFRFDGNKEYVAVAWNTSTLPVKAPPRLPQLP
ncbi:MAG TPA: S8 family serine peptidase [Blastocatellia bacterium]|nr:S8 family serine peptidase [Blastocatellia bacterium]